MSSTKKTQRQLKLILKREIKYTLKITDTGKSKNVDSSSIK